MLTEREEKVLAVEYRKASRPELRRTGRILTIAGACLACVGLGYWSGNKWPWHTGDQVTVRAGHEDKWLDDGWRIKQTVLVHDFDGSHTQYVLEK